MEHYRKIRMFRYDGEFAQRIESVEIGCGVYDGLSIFHRNQPRSIKTLGAQVYTSCSTLMPVTNCIRNVNRQNILDCQKCPFLLPEKSL